MIHYKDIIADGKYNISLVKLAGKDIKDIFGVLCKVNGVNGVEPVFQISRIVFDDDSEVGVEGEHDFPYLTEFACSDDHNLDSKTTQRLYNEMKALSTL